MRTEFFELCLVEGFGLHISSRRKMNSSLPGWCGLLGLTASSCIPSVISLGSTKQSGTEISTNQLTIKFWQYLPQRLRHHLSVHFRRHYRHTKEGSTKSTTLPGIQSGSCQLGSTTGSGGGMACSVVHFVSLMMRNRILGDDGGLRLLLFVNFTGLCLSTDAQHVAHR